MNSTKKKNCKVSKSIGCKKIKSKLEDALNQLKLAVIETESLINLQHVEKNKEAEDVD